MDKYNVRIKTYPTGKSQITLYKKAINLNYTRDEKLFFINELEDILATSTDKDKLNKARDKLNKEILLDRLSYVENMEDVPTSDKEKVPNLRKLYDNNKREKQVVYDIARSNIWDLFVTVTFNAEKIDRTDYSLCQKRLSTFMHNLRRVVPNIKYIFVPELHDDGVSYHFHGLLAGVDGLQLERAINGKITSKYYGLPLVDKNGNEVYISKQFARLGHCTITKVRDTNKVSRYITKYITKQIGLHLFGRHRHIASKNCNRPKTTYKMYDIDRLELLKDSVNPLWEEVKTVAENTPYNNTMHFIEINDDENAAILDSILEE